MTPERELSSLVTEAHRALARNRAYAARLLAQLKRDLPHLDRHLPRIARTLHELESRSLHRALGFRSFAAFARKHHLTAALRKARPLFPRATPPRPAPKRGSNAARAALARLERRLDRGLEAGDRTAWDVGTLFDRIARESHYLASGHPTLEAYADDRFPEHGYRTLSRYRRIALAFTRSTTVRHGVLKLDLALRYIDLTPAPERPAEIPRLSIAVPGKGPLPFARCTKRDLERAVQSLAAPREPRRLPRGSSTRVRTLETRLAGTPWKLARPRLTTRIAKDDHGRAHALVTIHDVPVSQLTRLAAALAP